MALPPPDLACEHAGCAEAPAGDCARGTLRGRGLGAPLPGVRLQAGDALATTDASGGFTLCDLPDGGAVVVSLDPAWELTADLLAPGAVELWASPTGAEAVGSYVAPRGAATHLVLSDTDARQTAGALGDPTRAARVLPGVARAPLDGGWLLVRGGLPGDTAVLVNELPVDGLLHVAGFASAVHPAALDHVSLSPTAPSPSTVTHAAGALDVTLRAPAAQPTAFAELTPAWVATSGAGAAGPVDVALAGRAAFAGPVLGVLLGPSAAAVAPRFADLSAQAEAGPVDGLAMVLRDTLTLPYDGGAAALVQQTEHAALHLHGGAQESWFAFDHHTIAIDDAGFRVGDGGPMLRWRARPSLALAPEVGAELGARRYEALFHGLSASRTLRHGAAWLGASAGDSLRVAMSARAVGWQADGGAARGGLSATLAGTAELGAHTSLWAEAAHVTQLPTAEAMLGTSGDETPAGTVADVTALGADLQRGPVRATLDGWLRFDRRDALVDLSLVRDQRQLAGADAQVGLYSSRSAAVLGAQVAQPLNSAPGPLSQPLLISLSVVTPLSHGWLLSVRGAIASGTLAPVDQTEVLDLLRGEARPLETTASGRLPATGSLDLRLAHITTLRHGWLEVALDVQNATSRRVPERALLGFAPLQDLLTYGLPVLPLVVVSRSMPSRQARESATSAR